jgi:hypothetical protein
MRKRGFADVAELSPSAFASRAAYLNARYCPSFAPPPPPPPPPGAPAFADEDALASATAEGAASFAALAQLAPPSSLKEGAADAPWAAAVRAARAVAEPAAARDTVVRHAPFDDSAPRFRRGVVDDLAREMLADPSRIQAHFTQTVARHPGNVDDLRRLLLANNMQFGRLVGAAQEEAMKLVKLHRLAEPRRLSPLDVAILAASNVSSHIGMNLSGWSDIPKAGGSFGRFFSSEDVLERVVKRVRRVIDADTVFVDFSCGHNEFGRKLAQRRWVGFDIFPPNAEGACPKHFRLKNWFSVEALPGRPEQRAEALVGLNPPFGLQGRTASEFIAHTFFLPQPPRLLALITPKLTAALELVAGETAQWLADVRAAGAQAAAPHGPFPGTDDGWMRLADVYAVRAGSPAERAALRAAARHPALAAVPPPAWVVVEYNDTLCAGNAFYIPGSRSSDKSFRPAGSAAAPSNLAVVMGTAAAGAGAGLEDADGSRGMTIRNDDPPVFAILSRGDAIVHPDDVVVRKDFSVQRTLSGELEKRWRRYKPMSRG